MVDDFTLLDYDEAYYLSMPKIVPEVILGRLTLTAWVSIAPRHREGPGISRSTPALMPSEVLYVPNLREVSIADRSPHRQTPPLTNLTSLAPSSPIRRVRCPGEDCCFQRRGFH